LIYTGVGRGAHTTLIIEDKTRPYTPLSGKYFISTPLLSATVGVFLSLFSSRRRSHNRGGWIEASPRLAC
jgi:hypothetical protein